MAIANILKRHDKSSRAGYCNYSRVSSCRVDPVQRYWRLRGHLFVLDIQEVKFSPRRIERKHACLFAVHASKIVFSWPCNSYELRDEAGIAVDCESIKIALRARREETVHGGGSIHG